MNPATNSSKSPMPDTPAEEPLDLANVPIGPFASSLVESASDPRKKSEKSPSKSPSPKKAPAVKPKAKPVLNPETVPKKAASPPVSQPA